MSYGSIDGGSFGSHNPFGGPTRQGYQRVDVGRQEAVCREEEDMQTWPPVLGLEPRMAAQGLRPPYMGRTNYCYSTHWAPPTFDS
ncbi:hypothetical protein CHARACLAT_009370 [Characodon lateralis]|uniref:Uncharacterized protein n=1 Tax=Characodon lateralis TaxID=208331 RepID=A0ABU7D5B5_9TELE|nr:hypothetical protein [Characodon lateralis]